MPNARARSGSRCDLRRGRAILTTSSESIQGLASRAAPDALCSRNVRSNAALCATIVRPPTARARSAPTRAIGGASATRASSMPVSCVVSNGIGRIGRTSEDHCSMISGPRATTTAASMISSQPGSKPVVSRSRNAISSSKPKTDSEARSASVAYAATTSGSVPGWRNGVSGSRAMTGSVARRCDPGATCPPRARDLGQDCVTRLPGTHNGAPAGAPLIGALLSQDR